MHDALAAMSDDELRALSDDAPVDRWGASCTAALPDGTAVFLKRLPLTAREHARPASTRNHFQLPTFYQYGVGSAGFGVWRELAIHARTTEWVRDGSCAAFPLLLHHRVMPRSDVRSAEGWVGSDDYVTYWNGSKRLRAFIDARRDAPYELWLVLQHVPHRMFEWILEHQDAASQVVDRLHSTLRFLHGHGVFHFDAHFGNVVTDGITPFLTDFGLATDRAFDLTASEHAFIDAHIHYDFGEVVCGIGNALLGALVRLPEDERRALLGRFVDEAPQDHGAIIDVLVDNVETLAAEELLGVTPVYADVVVRYRAVMLFMSGFFRALRTNPRKNTFFDDDRLRALLVDAGVDLA